MCVCLPLLNKIRKDKMTAASAIMSGEVSAHSLKTALIEKHGINIDSDPALALPFYNILHVFSLLSSLMDSPESSRRNNPPRSLINSGKGREEEEEVWTEHTPNINDGFRWKKYGQKIIQKSPYQRSYFKCSYAEEQGCKAKRKVQQTTDSPTLFEIIYSSRHTCHADAANNDTHGLGSTSMIEFNPQLPSVTDLDLPPLVTVDHHQEPIIHDHDHVPLRNHDDHDQSWLNSTIFPGNDMKTEDEDEQVLSPFLDVANFFADDFDFTF